MGGAIGGIAAAWEPDWFHKVILSSPMIRPLTEMFRGLQPPESLWRSAFWEKMKNT